MKIATVDELIKFIARLKLKLETIFEKVGKCSYIKSLFCLHNGDTLRAFTKQVDATCLKIVNKLQEIHMIENQKYIFFVFCLNIKNFKFKDY